MEETQQHLGQESNGSGICKSPEPYQCSEISNLNLQFQTVQIKSHYRLAAAAEEESTSLSSLVTPPSPSPSPSPSSSAVRLWRPSAQRNLKNQWLKLNSLRQDWRSTASTSLSRATAVVNSYLSQTYMDALDFGVLSDMPDIRKKACSKLLKQQEHNKAKLLSSYRDMVTVVTHMVSSCKTMRCYFKGTSNSPIAKFSLLSEGNGDSGDCGGIPVFTFCSISSFEELAWEIVQMFISELIVKRLLLTELLSIYDDRVSEVKGLHWSDELYDGEFNELSMLNLYSKETRQPKPPNFRSCKSSTSILQSKQQPDRNVLQIYLTTWELEVNIDRCRMDEIFATVGGEMRVNFLGTSVDE